MTSQEYRALSLNWRSDTFKVPSSRTEYLHTDKRQLGLRCPFPFQIGSGLSFYLLAALDSISLCLFLFQTTWAGGSRGSL